MKKLYSVTCYIFLLVSFACNSKSHKENTNIQLESIGQTSLMIDETTPDFSMGLQYLEVGLEMVFNINWTTNSLQMYDLENGELIKNIQFEREGDQGVGEFMAFEIFELKKL